MDRRTFIGAVAAGMVATPLAASAQTAQSVRRIGVLSDTRPPSPAEVQQIWAPARELGWIEGQNLIVESRYASDTGESLVRYAEELVRLNVEIIVTVGTAATIAAKNATTQIPIVMYTAGDPVRSGIVASLRRPGGNITGFSILGTELEVKQLELVRELLPSVQRVGVLVYRGNRYYEMTREEQKQVYRSVGVERIILEVSATAELEKAFAEASRQRVQALIVHPESLFYSSRMYIMRTARAHGLSTFVRGREYLEAGGLLSLGIQQEEQDRSLAYFVDKILRGAKPADLPIQQPTKFLLMINLKTAKALGLTIPQSLLLRADEVIQ